MGSIAADEVSDLVKLVTKDAGNQQAALKAPLMGR